jgi:hypothetical protein
MDITKVAQMVQLMALPAANADDQQEGASSTSTSQASLLAASLDD